MKKKLWKIRNKETGQFSKGGNNNERFIWTKDGKTWSNIGHVKNHLHTWILPNGNLRHDYPYNNSEVVEIEVDYNECSTVSVDEFIKNNMIDKNNK